MAKMRSSDTDAAIERAEKHEEERRFRDLWEAFGNPWLNRQKAFVERFAKTESGIVPLVAWPRLAEAIQAGKTVAITGMRGTGKTTLAVGAAYVVCRAGKAARHMTAWDLFAEFKESYGMARTPEREVLRRLGRVPLLILDELQERGETEWEDRTLVRLLDYRYGAELPTILISNLLRADFAKTLGVSICDRIAEAGTVIECNWTSFRQPTREQSL